MFRCHVVFAYFCANKLHQNVNTLAEFLFFPESFLGREREADYNFFKGFSCHWFVFWASFQVIGFISLLMAAE